MMYINSWTVVGATLVLSFTILYIIHWYEQPRVQRERMEQEYIGEVMQ